MTQQYFLAVFESAAREAVVQAVRSRVERMKRRHWRETRRSSQLEEYAIRVGCRTIHGQTIARRRSANGDSLVDKMSTRRVLSTMTTVAVRRWINVSDLKQALWSRLRGARAAMLTKLDGLSEYDRRRPVTPTGTNLLGLVKHLAGEEYGYLGETFARPPSVRPTWFRDDPDTEIDLWATPDESSEYIVEVYRAMTAHADETIELHDLASLGRVPHWPDNRQISLGSMLVLMVGETAQHAGHADIVRELIDSPARQESRQHEASSTNDRRDRVQAEADHFR